MIKTLQKKFIGIAMISVILVLTVLIGSINIINYANINRTIDARLSLLAENKGMLSAPPSGNPFMEPAQPEKEPALNQKFHSGISAETPFDTRYFTVTFDSEGNITHINTGNIASISAETAQEYAQSCLESGKRSGFFHNYKYCVVSEADGSSESASMYIFLNCERELDTFRSFLFASAAISLIGILLVFLLVVVFSRMIVQPVAESYEKQKRFITDAGHELKTPLTIIDANTEVLEMEQGENEWTQSIHHQTKRLAQLTEKLVFLSRMDEDSTVLAMFDFSLSDAVLEAAQPFMTVAEAQKKKLICSVEPNLSYHGNEEALRQLVSLLLDNAVKYSSENSEIRLSLSADGKKRILTVWNPASGLKAGRQDILFERFYRPDSSRSQTTGGHGIGLSAAKAIVSAHKGRITAQSEDGTSILFTVTL